MIVIITNITQSKQHSLFLIFLPGFVLNVENFDKYTIYLDQPNQKINIFCYI